MFVIINIYFSHVSSSQLTRLLWLASLFSAKVIFSFIFITLTSLLLTLNKKVQLVYNHMKISFSCITVSKAFVMIRTDWPFYQCLIRSGGRKCLLWGNNKHTNIIAPFLAVRDKQSNIMKRLPLSSSTSESLPGSSSASIELFWPFVFNWK